MKVFERNVATVFAGSLIKHTCLVMLALFIWNLSAIQPSMVPMVIEIENFGLMTFNQLMIICGIFVIIAGSLKDVVKAINDGFKKIEDMKNRLKKEKFDFDE